MIIIASVIVLVVTVVAREATILVLPLLAVTTIGGSGTLDATNPVLNVVDVVISNEDFELASVSKKGIAYDILRIALMTVDPVTLHV